MLLEPSETRNLEHIQQAQNNISILPQSVCVCVCVCVCGRATETVVGGRDTDRTSEEKRKEALNTVFDCDIAPPDKFAKRVSIKHDLAARQLSPRDRAPAAAGVDPVHQLPPVPPRRTGAGI